MFISVQAGYYLAYVKSTGLAFAFSYLGLS
jgi:hypothetical protein